MLLPLRLHGVWDSWGVVFDPIPFLCTDGTRRVRCWASLEALAKLAGQPSLEALDDVALAELFSGWVERFAELASAKFDRGQLQADGTVYVSAADVPRAAKPEEYAARPRATGARR